MKKILTLLSCSFLIFTTGWTQYINIPDSNFRKQLIYLYPTCFNTAGQLDTTCNAILNETSITVSNVPGFPGGGIHSLEGVNYFKNLISLNCWNLYDINTLGTLPGSLHYLNCSATSITSLNAASTSLISIKCDNCYSLASITNLPATLKYLDCSHNSVITTLPALPASLIRLDCNDCSVLGTLPPLPSALKFLDCTYSGGLNGITTLPNSLDSILCSANGISALPALPTSLKYLACSDNQMTTLPALPANLLFLECRNNHLTTLPALSGNLAYLDCSQNNLAALPALPPGIKKIICSYNELQSLPAMPAGLNSIICHRNMIDTLPFLPAGVTEIMCDENQLTAITNFPDSLISVSCTQNQLTSLPPLPGKLRVLLCNNNKITLMPSLPRSMTFLNCSQNNIYCMPIIPATTSTFSIHIDKKIACLPNSTAQLSVVLYNDAGQQTTGNVYLCNPTNNIFHCEALPVISGNIFYDYNNNGVKDAAEFDKPNLPVNLSNGTFTFTDSSGYFEIAASGPGVFTITPEAPNFYNVVPSSSTYNFINNDTIVSNNYALQANMIFDSLIIKLTPLNWAARPGYPFPYLVNYENAGTTFLTSDISLNYDNTKLTYDSSSNSSVINNGSTLSLSLGNFAPGQQGNFTGYFGVKTTSMLGDSISAKATITGNTLFAADSSIVIIKGSFDPNDKQATPQLSPSQVASGKYIDYTIRFQNTGTDTAFNIVISDTLSNLLQHNTLEMQGSSHNCKTTVKNNIVFFEFLNILLPDSNVSEIKSHGFVSFRIKPQTAVAPNTIIPNKAAIYFDYNAPVITNTAGTLIKDFTVVPLRLISFSAVPQTYNTASLVWATANEINTNHFVIEQGTDGLHFNAVRTVMAKENSSNHYSSSVADFTNNIVYYRLKIVDNDGSCSYSPIIKIDRRKNSTGLSVLSNPVKDFIIINTNDRTLNNTQGSIINSNGALVKSFTIQQGNQTVDMQGLPAGIYYLRTNNGSEGMLIR